MDNPAKFFQLLSDTTRVRILLLLNGRELCVCQLIGALGMSQPRISRQLAVLKHSDIVICSRNGKWNNYKINPDLNDNIKRALDSLPRWVGDDKLVESDSAALRACLKQQEITGKCDFNSFQGIREGINK